ncbi:hypothetical protein MPSEU_000010000 [Mayamaea pseudoterrestris]|nr:hypothetical protein MPSEU_000010000 [Mayamaea pseudoterrestris]
MGPYCSLANLLCCLCILLATKMHSALAFVAKRSRISTRRSLSATPLVTSTSSTDDDEAASPLIDPYEKPLVYPKSLSPSSITTFQSCPQSFLFQYMLGMSQPTTLALLKGRITHSALEQLFDLKPNDRTLENAQNLLRKSWSLLRNEEHLELFDSTESEVKWGHECLRLLENYVQIEDPMRLAQPAQREVWVKAVLKSDDESDDDSILVRGIVDRLDLVRSQSVMPQATSAAASFRITDYKTGKAPDLKYSPAFNQRIREEAFFQLQIYALLLREMRASKKSATSSLDPDNVSMREEAALLQSLPVTQLRLLYLTSHSGQAMVWDNDIEESTMHDTKQAILNVWKQIRELVDAQDPRAFVGCQRSFCYCHQCRDKFVPGSVWEP